MGIDGRWCSLRIVDQLVDMIFFSVRCHIEPFCTATNNYVHVMQREVESPTVPRPDYLPYRFECSVTNIAAMPTMAARELLIS